MVAAVASLALATAVLCLFALMIAHEWRQANSQTTAADEVTPPAGSESGSGLPVENSADHSSPAAAPPRTDVIEQDEAPPTITADPSPVAEPAQPREELTPLPPPRPWHEVAWRQFDTRREMPQPETLKNWFEPVVGQAFEFQATDTKLGRCGQLQGNSLARLKEPFAEHATLRLALDHHNRLRIHLYHGLVGVTLVYYEQDNYRWTAYATRRQSGSPLPTHAALTSTDDGRARRTEVRHGGPLELRYQAGEVILSRGEVALVRAALPGPPEDVYFQGQVAFQGIEWERTEGFPQDAAADPVAWATDQPAELAWQAELGRGAWLEALPDGALALIADQAKEKSHLTTPLAADGICEVTLHLEDATPGTGVFLQTADGRRDDVLRFVRNPPTGRTCLMLRGNDDGHEQGLRRLEEGVEPCVGQQVWVRMLFGCGTLRWWISADGRNWAEPEFTRSNMRGNITGIGVQHVANRESARIQIHGVTVRRLDRLSSLTERELLARAYAAHDLPNLPAWFDAIVPHRPAGVPTRDWRLACAVKTLSVGPTRDLGHALIAMLLDSNRAKALPSAERMELLERSFPTDRRAR
jgi:hypothetical protein